MASKPIFKFRTVLSLATLSACVLSFAPAAHASPLGGATGGVGGTLSPRNLELNGQGRANVARDGNAQLPRGEKLRDATGSASAEAKGAVTDKARQAQGTVSGTVSGTATADGAIAMEKAAAAKSGGAATEATGTAGKTAGTASAGGSAGVKREGRAVNASASGEASVNR